MNPLNQPINIALSQDELAHIVFLKSPAYNCIIIHPSGNTSTGHRITSIINVSKLTEIHYNYQGRTRGGALVISSDKRVWVIPHHHETMVAKL